MPGEPTVRVGSWSAGTKRAGCSLRLGSVQQSNGVAVPCVSVRVMVHTPGAIWDGRGATAWAGLIWAMIRFLRFGSTPRCEATNRTCWVGP